MYVLVLFSVLSTIFRSPCLSSPCNIRHCNRVAGWHFNLMILVILPPDPPCHIFVEQSLIITVYRMTGWYRIVVKSYKLEEVEYCNTHCQHRKNNFHRAILRYYLRRMIHKIPTTTISPCICLSPLSTSRPSTKSRPFSLRRAAADIPATQPPIQVTVSHGRLLSQLSLLSILFLLSLLSLLSLL